MENKNNIEKLDDNFYFKVVDHCKDKISRNLALDRSKNYENDDQLVANLFLGIVLEASEVANEFHKAKTVENYRNVSSKANTEEEMGDVFFYWLALCLSLDLDPNRIVKRNIDKMDERYIKMLEGLGYK